MSQVKFTFRYGRVISLLALIFVFVLQRDLSAQHIEVIHIDSIPKGGILLDKGWKHYAGDNPLFAKPEYDDSVWQTINPILNVTEQPQEFKTGINWLRLHFTLADNLRKESLAFIVHQFIASEIYLNGNLIYQFGKVSDNPEDVVAYNPSFLPDVTPVSFPTDTAGTYVVAVRYAVQSNLRYADSGENFLPLFALTGFLVNDAFRQVQKFERQLPVTNSFRIGAVFILACLYLVFFIYNPTQKAYLYFFLYAAFMMPGDILQINLPGELGEALFIVRLYYFLWLISGLFLLTAMYTLLNQKKGWVYWSLVIATFGAMPLQSWTVSTLIIGSLTNLELVRTSFKALRLQTRGAWIITAGATGFLLFMGTFAIGAFLGLNYFFISLGRSYMLADVLYGLGSLCIPVATVIYIALDFAFTGQKLKQKLDEVELLSSKSIEQEKEKQQILASINETLEKQVYERTAELSQSLNNLKSTQSQLIQSEKMASLGELTAGIAHEIQNPLNFVNNFSEVNEELLTEMKGELDKGNIDDAKSLAVNAIENQQKILHHGKRADAIVKGMLQHSRSSSGQKELTDINALCDEYLRLSYHGLRAKDKSFNAKFEIHLDPTLPKINVVPQDIGRVILNLINNGFYAVNEKRITNNDSYEPTVTVSTKKLSDKIEIRVKDNGPGIPNSIKEKIFQPFFTTKPTGQGTGLGLSLSYDIVKAHGGEIKIKTVENEGTEFIIILSE